MLFYLQSLLNDVINKEESEDSLTSEYKEVHRTDISQKFYCTECPARNDTTSSRELYHQPVNRTIK